MKPKKFVLIPDSFKGTMSSSLICSIMQRAILRRLPESEIKSIPVADGGEGSVDAFAQALGGERVTVSVAGPFMNRVDSTYIIVNGDTAMIEMASCAGLPLAEDHHLDPASTTTYGVGEMLLSAVGRGCRKIIIGLGGSCTVDGGCGAAAACGVKFINKSGETFVPAGGTLGEIVRIDSNSRDSRLEGISIVSMCDVDNPLHGKSGAAYVFGPQKGATPEMVSRLDEGLRNLDRVIFKSIGIDVGRMPGAGAAGGMGGGMVAFFGSSLQMGIETVLDTVGFDKQIKDADFVFTGEGKLDSQSLRGKAVIGIARRVRSCRSTAKVIAFVGDIGDDISQCYEEGVTAVFSINRVCIPFSEARKRAESDLELTVENFIRLIEKI
jgi:glycerate 2-kinase